jgi:hypothetical protein
MKGAKFFCDSCGAEVRREAAVCPECGRFFTSVRCPRCGFSGDQDAFKEGCPRCGYSRIIPGAQPSKRPLEEPGPAPLWMWFLALGIAAAVLAGLFAVLGRGR